MKYFIALIAGYYVLEAGRHLVRQIQKWNHEDSALPFIQRIGLSGVILLTAMFWPVMFYYGR